MGAKATKKASPRKWAAGQVAEHVIFLMTKRIDATGMHTAPVPLASLRAVIESAVELSNAEVLRRERRRTRAIVEEVRVKCCSLHDAATAKKDDLSRAYNADPDNGAKREAYRGAIEITYQRLAAIGAVDEVLRRLRGGR